MVQLFNVIVFFFFVYVLIDCLLLIYCGFLGGNRETRDLENEENANSPVNSEKT